MKKLATHRSGIALTLVVVPDVDVDLLSLALDHENRCPVPGLRLGRFPNHDVGARTPAPVHGPPLLIHLLEGVTVVVVQVQNEVLPDRFFRPARHISAIRCEEESRANRLALPVFWRALGSLVSGAVVDFLLVFFAIVTSHHTCISL